MKKRVISFLLLATLLLTAFCACSKKPNVLTSQEAQKIAIEELGITEDDVTEMHIHIADGDIPGYNIHITVGEKSYGMFVDAATGEVSPLDYEGH